MFSQKLKGQAGILKQKTTLSGIPFGENSLITLTGYYEKIFHKTKRRQIIIVEVIISVSHRIFNTYLDIDIFKNAPALKKLLD